MTSQNSVHDQTTFTPSSGETTRKLVTIHYVFRAPDGRMLGSSNQSGPFSFVRGSGDAIPGLDRALSDVKPGDERRFVVAAEDAYGPRDETLVAEVPRDAIPEADFLQPGMRVSALIGDRERDVTITAITDDTVTLDANHPLAGMDLDFDVSVLSVVDAPEQSDSSCGCGGTCGCGGHH